MPKIYFGSKTEPGTPLERGKDLIAVRSRGGGSLHAEAELRDGVLVAQYPDAGVEVYRVPVKGKAKSVSQRKLALRRSEGVRFAGGVLVDTISRDPVLYTENLFVKFADAADPAKCLAVLQRAGLTLKEQVTYATNAFFVAVPEGTGQKVFTIANRLLKRKDVEAAHPEVIRPRESKAIAPRQWHLQRCVVDGNDIDASANVAAAHQITRGTGVVIAIIDDGFDIHHPEFAGAGKIVAPRDATEKSGDPRPKDAKGRGPKDGENHGTACAGVACASGAHGASGVAPEAKLMPIRLVSGAGSQQEADAFRWAAEHGADIISCSWGLIDGEWSNPGDPRHNQTVTMTFNSKLAIDFATSKGRGGKGCVVLFAAGNGREPADNDGYAKHEKVIAVGACNDRGKRSVYSDTGKSLFCVFPSGDRGHPPFNHPEPLTTGIWTTDRLSPDGYNPGHHSMGDDEGDYTNDFTGTSASCPGAAGVVALVLAVNKELTLDQVKEVLRLCCDKIDEAGGGYVNGHSALYGHGRLNARKAVDIALAMKNG